MTTKSTDTTKMNILKDKGKYFFFNSLVIEDTLKPKEYLFNFDEFGNCWLEDVEPFNYPDKIYDVNKELKSLIKKSFDEYSKNLGVLLTGNKGMGKTLEAKLICEKMNLPIILINKPIPQSVNFINFFNTNIKQDYVLYVDEFEKTFKQYDNSEGEGDKGYHKQQIFLSFMDGVLNNEHKILFLLTTNEDINEYFINRPSRIKFVVEYNELSETLFALITQDKLKNKKHLEDLENNVSLINLNIDLLISIIEDINLFNKPFSEFKELYNYKFENYKYEVFKMVDGVESLEPMFYSHQRVKNTDLHVNGNYVKDWVKFTKEEIIFTAMVYDESHKTRTKTKEATFKLVPFTFSVSTKYTF
jgi:hypothetical protein